MFKVNNVVTINGYGEEGRILKTEKSFEENQYQIERLCDKSVFWTYEKVLLKYNDMPTEPVDQPKTLSNSEIWKLAEDGLREGEKFQLDKHPEDIIVFNGNEFQWDNGSTLVMDVTDKWLPLPSKPQLSKREAEEMFGVEIID